MAGRGYRNLCGPAQYDWNRTWSPGFSRLDWALPLLSWVSFNVSVSIVKGRICRKWSVPRSVWLETPMVSWCAPGLPWALPLPSWVSINVYISDVKGGAIAICVHPLTMIGKRPRSPGVLPGSPVPYRCSHVCQLNVYI